jgi:hypothetical protein
MKLLITIDPHELDKDGIQLKEAVQEMIDSDEPIYLACDSNELDITSIEFQP